MTILNTNRPFPPEVQPKIRIEDFPNHLHGEPFLKNHYFVLRIDGAKPDLHSEQLLAESSFGQPLGVTAGLQLRETAQKLWHAIDMAIEDLTADRLVLLHSSSYEAIAAAKIIKDTIVAEWVTYARPGNEQHCSVELKTKQTDELLSRPGSKDRAISQFDLCSKGLGAFQGAESALAFQTRVDFLIAALEQEQGEKVYIILADSDVAQMIEHLFSKSRLDYYHSISPLNGAEFKEMRLGVGARNLNS